MAVSIQNYLKKLRSLPRLKLRIWFICINTFILVAITILLQYTSTITSDEAGFLKWYTLIRNHLFGLDEKPLGDSVVFLDVSKDLSLQEDDSYGGIAPLHGAQNVITDRHKLAALFSILNEHPQDYRFVLCDVLFDQPSDDDTLLQPQIEQLKRVVVSAVIDEHDSLITPVFHVPFGVVNYYLQNGSSFSRMLLNYKDTIKTLPAYMLEQTTNYKVGRKGFYTTLNGRPAFNSIIPQFYYRPSDMRRTVGQGQPNCYYLGEILNDADCFEHYLKNKYIVIGNFTTDRHNTYLGSFPGSLILLNVFLTLQKQSVIITAWWLLFLWISYCILNYFIMIHPRGAQQLITKKVQKPLLQQWLLHYVNYILFLIIINMLCLAWFNHFLSIFYIATYLTTVDTIIEKWDDISHFRVIKLLLKTKKQ
ncbi:MAG TPA: hypothetical protein VG738_18905 [Chitinophagaceae bacterium]|nr:hypothetical protein [Chitinophagaceae bacterium]